ncbi:DNA alkylation repair protein [Devosia sp. A16]|uniref:DNA alkylation repair protein n=1 Tax=Devosia sp. A16 TaxID=1736675 RepID=UPI0006D77225|nr:DNA alkylation repair protein [Devosia sp. A16]
MELTAEAILARLQDMRSDEERQKYHRYFSFEDDAADTFIGVRMGEVFALAKQCLATPPSEIEKLMESGIHEARAAAMSIMAKQYQARHTTLERKQELFELYLRRHDRINDWDLVDLAAYHVVGPHLVDRRRDVLYRLAKSTNPWERRTAILATFSFIRRGQLDDAFAIAELLLDDPQELVQKAVGWMLRTTDGNRPALDAFLDQHAANMPRIMLRNALEHYAPDDRARYLAMGKGK